MRSVLATKCPVKKGDSFGRLTVCGAPFYLHSGVKRKNAHRRAHVVCECICGNRVVNDYQSLKGESIRSCGCLCRESLIQSITTHGMAGTPEHRAWKAMKTRCGNRNVDSYKRYGGRGIVVCDRWSSSFENFYADMGPKPSRNHSMDRIDPNGNYEPGNCRWADTKTQARNKRNNFFLTANGETKTLAEWAETTGINYMTLLYRLKRGWQADDAVSAPLDTSRKSKRQLEGVSH